MSFHLLPKEKIINSYPCSHKRDLNGTMHISNIRVCWVPDEDVADKIAEVDIPMSEIDPHNNVQFVDQKERSVLLINAEGKKKTFSFSDIQFQKSVRLVDKDLKIAKRDFESIGMGAEEKYKLTKLMETPYLKDLFKDLVETGKITEEEFWNTMADMKQFTRKETETKMEGGVSNKRLILSNKYILDTNSAEINLEKEDAVRLLNEYPKMRQIYDLKVTDQEGSEKEFWEYNLKKNYDYKTEIFGGENPIYTGTTEQDEKEYEDRYINKDIAMLGDDENEEEKELAQKLRKIDNSINVIFNKDDELRPQGYGNYEPTLNADIGIEGQEIREPKNLKKLEKEEEENEKLLKKYNKYSERILSKNADEKIAVSDVERYKNKSSKTSKDVDMRIETVKHQSALNPNKIKTITEEQVGKNYKKISELSSKMLKFRDAPLLLNNCFPDSAETKDYLENITSKAYKLTLRVTSEDIESRIPENILEQQHFYQNKHDKLLQLFYNKFPITDKNKEDLGNVIGMKDAIIKLGKEITDLIKKMNKHNEYRRYISIYDRMKKTLIIALQKLKQLKPEE